MSNPTRKYNALLGSSSPPCNQSNNFCGTGNGNNPGGPPQKQPPTPPGNNPKDKQGCQNILCDIINPGRFWQGVAEVSGGLAIMGTALAGMIYSGGGLWLKFILTLAKQGMAKAGYYIVQMIKNGMQNIVDSLQSINPWVKFALDVLQVAVDITSLVITGVDIFRNVDPRRGATFLAKLTTIAQAVFRNQMSGTFGIVVGSLAADLFSFIGTSDSLLNDTETLVSDFNTARDS